MWPTEPDLFESLLPNADGSDTDDAIYFIFIRDEVLCLKQGMPRPITQDEFRWLGVEVTFKHFLGKWETKPCYVIDGTGPVPEGYVTIELRSLMGKVELAFFYLAGRAKQILEWHRDNQFCGCCGARTCDHDIDRAKQCLRCGLLSYPRISPSIIVLVQKGDRMLLARNANWPAGRYSALAGFVEPGESVEQTVHREVHEEVGISVTNVRYLGSQPWPFPNSLMLGFYADYDSGEIVCHDGEIAEASWFDYKNSPIIPSKTGISGWLIDAFVEERARINAG